jgi:hypothetical protein
MFLCINEGAKKYGLDRGKQKTLEQKSATSFPARKGRFFPSRRCLFWGERTPWIGNCEFWSN